MLSDVSFFILFPLSTTVFVKQQFLYSFIFLVLTNYLTRLSLLVSNKRKIRRLGTEKSLFVDVS